MKDWIIGIDEVGRGPLAGPVAVGVVLVTSDFDWGMLAGVNDSKKLTPEKRFALFRQATNLRRQGLIDWQVSMVGAPTIDKNGIVPAIKSAMSRALTKISPRVPLGKTQEIGKREISPRVPLGEPGEIRGKRSLPRGTLGKLGDGQIKSGVDFHTIDCMEVGEFYERVMVKLDGGLRAPVEYLHQETIIKGDSKEKVIGLASVVAKVTRDRYMVRKSAELIYAPYDFATHKGYGTKKHIAAIKENGLSSLHRQSFCCNLLR